MHRRTAPLTAGRLARGAAVAMVLSLLGVAAAACTANDNGGVIQQGPTTAASTTTVAP